MKLLVGGAVAVLLVLPAVLSSYAVTVFIFIFFYAYLAQAWNIVGGYAGQLSAGHAAFVGIGAYTSAVLSVQMGLTPWVGMFVGGALSAVLGTVIGYLGFRFGLRGFYFVLLTVAFAEICRIVALNTDAVGGALGYYITFTGNPRQFQFQRNWVYYYVALGLMLAATGIVAWLERLRFGVYLTAIRQDESACEALGVDTFRCKLLAMVLSSFLTGIGRNLLRVLPFLAPAQLGVRHPAIRGDHHPGDRRRRWHRARPDPRIVHPVTAGRAVAHVPGDRRPDGSPPDRVRRPADRAWSCSCPKGRIRTWRAWRAGGRGADEPARGRRDLEAVRRAPGRARPVAVRRSRAKSWG